MDSLDYAEGHATAQRGEERDDFRSDDYYRGYLDAASLPRRAAETTSAVDKAWDDIDAVMADPATSDWLKEAIRTSLLRDCRDAINDAETLVRLYQNRINAVFGRVQHEESGQWSDRQEN